MPQKRAYNKRLYDTWRGMNRRCYEEKNISYKHYGNRGISVCPEWRDSYRTFRDWALSNGYADNLTIDRIDSNGNYEPSNCRWLTRNENCRRERGNVFITIGNATKTMAEWARITNMSRQVLSLRYSKTESLDELFKSTTGLDEQSCQSKI